MATKAVKRKPTKKIVVSSVKGATQFRNASKQYVKSVGKSKASARDALIGIGILTASGKLARKYKK